MEQFIVVFKTSVQFSSFHSKAVGKILTILLFTNRSKTRSGRNQRWQKTVAALVPPRLLFVPLHLLLVLFFAFPCPLLFFLAPPCSSSIPLRLLLAPLRLFLVLFFAPPCPLLRSSLSFFIPPYSSSTPLRLLFVLFFAPPCPLLFLLAPSCSCSTPFRLLFVLFFSRCCVWRREEMRREDVSEIAVELCLQNSLKCYYFFATNIVYILVRFTSSKPGYIFSPTYILLTDFVGRNQMNKG